MISGGALEQEGSGRGGGGVQYVRGKYKPLRGDESDICSKKAPLYITRLVLLIIQEDLMLHVVCNVLKAS